MANQNTLPVLSTLTGQELIEIKSGNSWTDLFTTPSTIAYLNGPAALTQTIQTPVVTAGGALTVDMNKGWYVPITLNGSVTALNIINWPALPWLGRLTLEVTNGGGYQISWPASRWPNGTAPTLTPGGVDIVLLHSSTAGASIFGSIVGQSYS